MRDSRALQSITCALTIASATVISFLISGGFGPHIDRAPHAATGTVIAQQALALLKPGGHLIVIARDTTDFKNPASDIQLASFRRELSRAKVTISSLHSIQIDPLRPVEVPAGDFFELLHKTNPGDVIVSFMGPPLLSEAQISGLASGKPAVVAFCSGTLADQVDLRSLFGQGLLQAAVITKKNPASGAPKSSSLPEFFDRSFSLITPSNLAMLSPPTQ